MHIPKRYGQSRIDRCPFCQRQATTSNKQGIPVCIDHQSSMMDVMKCVCGQTLDIRTGKWGVYFTCMNCGNMNMRKVLEFNEVKDVSNKEGKNVVQNTLKKNLRPEKQDKKPGARGYRSGVPKKRPREITIRSDDPLYFS